MAATAKSFVVRAHMVKAYTKTIGVSKMKPKIGQFLHGKDSWTPKRSPQRAANVVKFSK